MKQKIWMILSCVGLTFLFGWWLWSAFHMQQNKLCSESSLVFAEVIKIEREFGNYNPMNSPNEISWAEKSEWCDQDFLFYRDSSRFFLDSLFRTTLLEYKIKAETAIRCIRNGRVIDTSLDSTFYKKAFPLKLIVYRRDENPDRNITLQAYIKYPFGTVWRHSYLMWMISGLGLLLFGAIIGGYCFWYKKMHRLTEQELQLQQLEQKWQVLNQQHEQQRAELQRQQEQQRLELQRQQEKLKKQEQQQKQERLELRQQQELQQLEARQQQEQQRLELQQRQEKLLQLQQKLQEKEEQLPSQLIQDKTIKWVELSKDLFFDEEHGDLCYREDVNIRLTGNLLNLFRCFIKAEQYKLTYERICIDILARPVKNELSKSDRDAVASTIRNLRTHLKPLSFIQIESIRSTGYQMLISNPEDLAVKNGVQQ